jgi:hypothetical protein
VVLVQGRPDRQQIRLGDALSAGEGSAKRVVFLVTASALLAASSAHAVGLDTHGTGQPVPPQVVVTCASFQDFAVTSFADVLAIRFTGYCTASFPGTNIPPTNAASYEVSGTWDSKNGSVKESLKGPDGKGQNWQVNSSGVCQKDPWMTGPAAASCGGPVVSASPNAPMAALQSFKFPISAGILDAQARGVLTGKTLAAIQLEHEPPTIGEPQNGAKVAFPSNLVIIPYLGAGAQSYAVEWQALVNAAWVPEKVFDEAGLTTPLPADRFGASRVWRVRARAHQSTNARWSDWHMFEVPLPAIKLGCLATKPYGATYDVTGMPATMKAGALPTTVPIRVTNGSNQTWGAGSNFHLSYHWAQNGAIVIQDGKRTVLAAPVAPCQSVLLTANVQAPPTPGTWTIEWDMVNDTVTWFSGQGVPTANRAVSVAP